MKGMMMLAFLTMNLLALDAQGQTVTREDLRKTVEHIQRLAREQQAELDETKKAHAETKVALESARQQLVLAKAENERVREDVAKLTDWGVAQQRAAQEAQSALSKERASHEATKARYGRLKLVCALIAALGAAAISLVISHRLLPILTALGAPWVLGVFPTVAAIGGFALAWFFT